MPQTRPHTVLAALVAALLVLTLAPVAAAQPAPELLITARGVGPALLGSTVDELADQLGPGYEIGDEVPITVDFDGRVVTRDGEVMFRAAVTGSDGLLTLFIVANPAYTTAEGVGPTTTIAAAEAVYGAASLAWNPDNEGREFVSFADGPEGRIAFRTPGIGGNYVGIYDEGELETTEYRSDAAIASVWVSCIPGTDCPADLPPATDDGEGTGDGDGGTDDGTDDGTDGTLPNTGLDEAVLTSLVAVLFLGGGALVITERRLDGV